MNLNSSFCISDIELISSSKLDLTYKIVVPFLEFVIQFHFRFVIQVLLCEANNRISCLKNLIMSWETLMSFVLLRKIKKKFKKIKLFLVFTIFYNGFLGQALNLSRQNIMHIKVYPVFKGYKYSQKWKTNRFITMSMPHQREALALKYDRYFLQSYNKFYL